MAAAPAMHPELFTTSNFDALVRDVGACRVCGDMAYSHVLGTASGPVDADVMFVAEAVGRRGGAVTGVPLTHDESGKRFDAFLRLAGVDRHRVFITNAVLCNPLDRLGRNRAPSAREVGQCRPFLERTLEAVRPHVVVALGAVALASLGAIAPHGAELHRDAATALAWRGITLVPMYHPSRQSTLHRSQRAQEADWRYLGEVVARLRRSSTQWPPKANLVLHGAVLPSIQHDVDEP